MPYKLPNLAVSTEGDEDGANAMGPHAIATLASLEKITESVISGVEKRVQQLRTKQEQVRAVGARVTAKLREVENSGVSPPASPLLASVSSGLPLPPITALPPTAAAASPITSTSAAAAFPPASASDVKPNAEEVEDGPLPGVLIKDVRVKRTKKEKDDAASKENTVAKTETAAEGDKTDAESNANNNANSAKLKPGEGVDWDRKNLVELRFPSDTEVISELKILRDTSMEYLEELQNISDLFSLRSALLSSSSQAKQMLGQIDQALDEISVHLIDYRDMHKDFLRGRSDLEKSINKHPTSEYIFRRRLLHSSETWDLIDDCYRGLITDFISLQLIFKRDLPLVSELISMEGSIGGMSGGGTEMMFM